MKISGILLLTALSVTILVSYSSLSAKQRGSSMIKKEVFGKFDDGTIVHLYTLRNSRGMEARITNYGGILVSLLVPGKSGKVDDVVLGNDSLADYVRDNPYFGCLVGRYGNRIAKGKFTLDGKEYSLAKNNGANHLHGGLKGFDKVVWAAREQKVREGSSLALTYVSRDGEEGYPGNLSVKVIYTITENNELKIRYTATTDKPTIVNLTHHSYFNLAGAGRGDILAHEMMIDADRFTPIDSGLIPTGELRPVRGTPMDFTVPAAIGGRIDKDDEQLQKAGGYDHNFVLNKTGPALKLAARVFEKTSGRVMEVLTTEPGLQFYSGNFLDGRHVGKDGRSYKHRYGFCLETQHFPDSPNKPTFPSTVVRPGETYSSTTIYKFDWSVTR